MSLKQEKYKENHILAYDSKTAENQRQSENLESFQKQWEEALAECDYTGSHPDITT